MFNAPREVGFAVPLGIGAVNPNERPFMKFVSLKTKRPHPRTKLDKPPGAAPEGFTKPRIVSHQIHTYAELRRQIHDDLRLQHPEWIEPNGESAMCDAYEARLMELLNADAKGLS